MTPTQLGTRIGLTLATIIIITTSCTDLEPSHTPRTITPPSVQLATTTTTTPPPTTTSTTVKRATTTTNALRDPGFTPPDYHQLPDWPTWHAIGRCEQPGPGPDGIAWNHGPHSSYPGGLGILRSSWNAYRHEAGITITNAAYATPYQQILVARAIRHHFGLTGWTSVPHCTGPL